LPVGAQAVVALAFLRVREDLVGLVDLLEALGRLLRLIHIRMMLSRQSPVGLLDGLSIGGAVDPEDLVVVSVLHHTPEQPGGAPGLATRSSPP